MHLTDPAARSLRIMLMDVHDVRTDFVHSGMHGHERLVGRQVSVAGFSAPTQPLPETTRTMIQRRPVGCWPTSSIQGRDKLAYPAQMVDFDGQ